jgi:23S rRNA U2552 (ribose-2'-O)-methylase RlmE/FtsJ
MNEIKEKIASREKDWDVIKKYTNPYEYIHSVVPLRKKSISKYKPISRSYFKMIEILRAFRVDDPFLPNYKPRPIKTFHLAEGPGGFIEAVCNKRANPLDSYTGMTILYDETDDNVPAWNKTEYFLSKNPNVHIETGADGTGNIMRLDNFDHCINKYGASMDLITADGGFDFSQDFNKQELIITNLLWGQTCYALCMQKHGGNFVLKIFDCFYEQTIDIMYLLSSFYQEVNVCKLQTSRLGNSEKYLVCRGFRMTDNRSFLSTVRRSFYMVCQNEQIRVAHLLESCIFRRPAVIQEELRRTPERFLESSGDASIYLSNRMTYASPPTACASETQCEARHPKAIREKPVSPRGFRTYGAYAAMPDCLRSYETLPTSSLRLTGSRLMRVSRLLDFPVPRYFVKRVEEMNAVFGQQQIENIHYTISIIDKNSKHDRLEQLTKQNTQKCIAWCVDHGIAYNNFSNSNMFVDAKRVEEDHSIREQDAEVAI